MPDPAVPRALILTNNPNLGSTARILQSWLKRSRRQNWNPALLLPREGPLTRWLASEQIEHSFDPMPWPDRRKPFTTLYHATRVARWARQRGVGVIHCNEHDVYPFALLLRRLLTLPLVCHVRYRISAEFARWAFAGKRCPDALLWTSLQQKRDCQAAVEGIVPEDRQHLVPLGLDLRDFGSAHQHREATRANWGIKPDHLAIGMATAFRPRKRIEDFVEIVERLAAKNPRVVGVLAGGMVEGDEAYLDRIHARIRRANLDSRFRLVGDLEEVEPFYHAIDLFVSTSEYETFGNSVCEAMACGKPVVAYEGGSVAEVVGDSGRIVPNRDVDGAVDALTPLLDDASLRAQWGGLARERVASQFDPQRSLRLVQSIHATICQSESRSQRLESQPVS